MVSPDFYASMPTLPTTDAKTVSSSLAPALIQAYVETDYCVCASPTFVLHVDQACPALAAYYLRQGVTAACVLTAWNPLSQPLGKAENQTRQQALEKQLQQAGWRWLRAVGKHPHNGWPPEPSCFIEGMALDAACEWGRQHGQNAVICCGADAVARLVLLR